MALKEDQPLPSICAKGGKVKNWRSNLSKIQRKNSLLQREEETIPVARMPCFDFKNIVIGFNESQMLTCEWSTLKNSPFQNIGSTRILRSCFSLELGQREKHVIPQAVQTGGSISCLRESFVVKVVAEKTSSTNIQPPDGVFTEIEQDPSSWSA